MIHHLKTKILSNRFMLFILLLGLTLVIYANFVSPRMPAFNYRQFLGKNLQFSQPSDFKPYNSTSLTTNLPASNAVSLQITFYFRCHPDCPLIWVEIPTPNTPLQLTAFSPLLNRLNYARLTNDQLSFYQAAIRFGSIDQLLKYNYPLTLYAEPFLFARFANSPIKTEDFHALHNSNIVPEYILTTYLPPRVIGGFYEFSRILSPKNLKIIQDRLTINLKTASPAALIDLTPLQVKTTNNQTSDQYHWTMATDNFD